MARIGFENLHETRIVGRLRRGHKESPEDKILYNTFKKYNYETINVPFLVMLLQTADDFDVYYKRASIKIYEKIP